jgi:tellurite resistance protein TehA-like permease
MKLNQQWNLIGGLFALLFIVFGITSNFNYAYYCAFFSITFNITSVFVKSEEDVQ